MLIYLLLGCNMGDCFKTFTQAKVDLKATIGNLVTESSLYKTDAWGKTNQEPYLNQALCFETKLDAKNCLQKILSIETKLGRIRAEKWEPRTIDIDILICDGELIINEPDLQIPHPYLQERKFALQPLAEIAGSVYHPIFKTTIDMLLQQLNDNSLKVIKL